MPLLEITWGHIASEGLLRISERKSRHFFRYCLINRDMFESKGTDLGPTRTKQSYQNSVAMSEGQEICEGAKFDSVFNCLKHFHVCDPGLPPCLAHDLFEGVVSTDLALYIKQLVTSETLQLCSAEQKHI